MFTKEAQDKGREIHQHRMRTDVAYNRRFRRLLRLAFRRKARAVARQAAPTKLQGRQSRVHLALATIDKQIVGLQAKRKVLADALNIIEQTTK